MFKIGDIVVYETLGVCRIADIRTETFDPLPAADYYVLQLLYGARTTVYAPVGSQKIRIRAALTRDEVLSLICAMPDMDTCWVENDVARAEQFRAILKTGEPLERVRLVKTLYLKRESLSGCSRKFHSADERLLREAENLLHEEFAHALSIAPDAVPAFIEAHLQDLENGF